LKSIPFSTLKPGLKFSGDVFLDDNYILLTPEMTLSEELMDRLKAWGYHEIFQSEGTAAPVLSEGEEGIGEEGSELLGEDGKQIAEVQEFYQKALEYTHKLFQFFIRRNQVPLEPLTEQVKSIIKMVRSHRRYILRFSDLDRADYAYLISHSVNTAILAIALGEALKVPAHKIIDLGMAGLLHEIGMLKLPEKLQNSKNPLSMDEKRALSAHPIIGFRTLKDLGFSPNVYVPVLQHHERMDGTGYPQGLTEERIADSRNPHSSLLDLLKDIGRNHDEKVLRRLVFVLGLYPLGSFLQINTGAIAQVIESNPENPKKPILRILTTPEKKPLAEPQEINMMEDSETTITKVFEKEEINTLRESKIISR